MQWKLFLYVVDVLPQFFKWEIICNRVVDNLQQTIISLCIDNIVQIMGFFFLTALISFIGYKEEWGEIEKLWEIIGVISSITLVVLLIIYLVPLTMPSLKNIF